MTSKRSQSTPQAAPRRASAASLLLRIALGVAFLSAVADRFGVWGASGATNVAWGNFEAFVQYTAQVNSFLPSSLAPFLAWTATLLEVVLGIALIVGFRLRITAAASGALLLGFAVAMTFSFGIKAPLDYSVLTAATAAFYLAAGSAKKTPKVP